MTADKRTVTTDALETLGMKITENEKRDAIHLAVDNAVAGERLYPGQHITIQRGVAMRELPGEGLGIVDPFLADPVMPGERFWLVVYPRRITSLRHVWTHPDFDDDDPLAVASAAESDPTEVAKLRISDIAQAAGISYDVMMEAADEWIETHDSKWGGEYLCLGGLLESKSVPDEFWDHYEKVRGVDVGDKRGSFFTCSC